LLPDSPQTFRSLRVLEVVAFLCIASTATLHASTLFIGGGITQSTQDGTGPAGNNPSLNGILDVAIYSVDLNFTGAISSPGTYDLTGSSLLFSVTADGAEESNFSSVGLTVAQSGASDRLTLHACLSTGSGCNQGNELDLRFTIPSASLNDQNVTAQGIAGLVPLDLLEDDGVTDIQGSVTSYSYSQTPEPAPTALVGAGLIAVSLIRRKRRMSSRNSIH
jgi:hypothetical protein